MKFIHREIQSCPKHSKGKITFAFLMVNFIEPAALPGWQMRGKSPGAVSIKYLLLDSRKVNFPPDSLFFAIRGKRHDGHRFIEELYQKGVRLFVTEQEPELEKYPEATFFLVKDSVHALQNLAAAHRKKHQIPVIGITGSNGKTIVKEWLYQLLNKDFKIVRSPKSYNSQTGVPLSVWLMNEEHTLGIFEAGISLPGEMELLQKVIQPTIGIFTNIGEAHSEGFLNLRHKVREKLKLFIQTEVLICCRDHPDIMQAIAEVRKQLNSDQDEERFKTFTWSRNSEADLQVVSVSKSGNQTKIGCLFKGERFNATLPFTDEASLENALHCIAALLVLGIDATQIATRLEGLTSIAMRLELKQAINECVLINDSYNSDLSSLAIALDFLNQQRQHRQKTVILSDILQSGRPDRELYEEVCRLMSLNQIAHFIGIGPALIQHRSIFETQKLIHSAFYPDTDSFLARHDLDSFSRQTILLKGARIFEFERISRLLEQKVHQTVLEVNLNSLAHNLHTYREKLKPGVKMMVMVKALGYGTGSREIASLMEHHKVDYLAVAYADEGVELRKSGISLPIMVMNPEPGSFDAMLEYKLEPEIYSLFILDKFEKALSGRSGFPLRFPVHLKLDTGMHRLGFMPEDIPALLQRLKDSALIRVASVFSHLSASGSFEHDRFTHQQKERFLEMSEPILKMLDYPIIRHLVNSEGILRFPDFHFDMVRLGLGLYGIDGSGILQPQLMPAGALKAVISQIKTIPAGEPVGYNLEYQAEKDTRIGIVGIGYADGLDRRLGNGTGKMLVNEQIAPIIGNVCMDMCMIDLTDIEGVEEGQQALVFGPGLPVTEIAQTLSTITYELLTRISSRVKRVYFQD